MRRLASAEGGKRMYAVVESGGKQYRVSEGDRIRVEKIDAEEGSEIELTKVLLLGRDDGPTIGTPLVEGAVVKARVASGGKEDKIIIFKYRRKKNYRRFRGHRQQYTDLIVESIKG
jgi:large subunit ribosomal protein L21